MKNDQANKNLVPLDKQRLDYFGPQKSNEVHFKRALSQILKVRVPDTPGHKEVHDYIANEMSSLGWSVTKDRFEQDTVAGRVKFANIIATLNPNAPRRLVIACHYDSLRNPQGFLGNFHFSEELVQNTIRKSFLSRGLVTITCMHPG